MRTTRRTEPRTDAERELLSYLQQIARLRATMPGVRALTYKGIEDFLLRHGSFYTPTALPQEVTRGIMKACYHNAFRLAARRKSLRFVEGVAVGIIPVDHAWCVNARGEVIDPTWEDATSGERAKRAYFGVEINLTAVRRAIRDHESYSVLQSDWMRAKRARGCVLLGQIDEVIDPKPFFTALTADRQIGGAL